MLHSQSTEKSGGQVGTRAMNTPIKRYYYFQEINMSANAICRWIISRILEAKQNFFCFPKCFQQLNSLRHIVQYPRIQSHWPQCQRPPLLSLPKKSQNTWLRIAPMRNPKLLRKYPLFLRFRHLPRLLSLRSQAFRLGMLVAIFWDELICTARKNYLIATTGITNVIRFVYHKDALFL